MIPKLPVAIPASSRTPIGAQDGSNARKVLPAHPPRLVPVKPHQVERKLVGDLQPVSSQRLGVGLRVIESIEPPPRRLLRHRGPELDDLVWISSAAPPDRT